jgi:UDP-N-acetyl-2-amino-2-deoxyglucuronate dehydrogenase
MPKINNKKINFAVIGTGKIADNHIKAIASLKIAKVVGVLSLYHKNRGTDLSRRFGFKNYRNYEEILNDETIQAIDIIARNDLHASLGIRAAQAGKHIIIEKPIATTLKDVDRLVKASVKNKIKFSVVFQNRFAPLYKKLKQDINAGKYGKINFIFFSWELKRDHSYFAGSPWRRNKKQAGGGAMMMNGIHLIDLLAWLFGPIKSVYGKIDNLKRRIPVEDTAYAFLNFANQIKGYIYCTTAGKVSLSPRLMIFSDKGRFEIYDHNYRVDNFELLKEQFKDFIKSIKNNRAPSIDGWAGRKALAAVITIYESAKKNQEIRIK